MPTKKKEPTRGERGEEWGDVENQTVDPSDNKPTGTVDEDEKPPTYQEPVKVSEEKAPSTLEVENQTEADPDSEFDPEREASAEEVAANQDVESTKGDLAPQQPTGPAPSRAPIDMPNERTFIVAVKKLGSFRYGQQVTQSMLKVDDANLERLLRSGHLSEV